MAHGAEVVLHLMVGNPVDLDSPQECADCGFDAVLTYPLMVLYPTGVTPVGTYRACVRCTSDQES